MGREQIFRINLAKVPQDDSINTEALAASTPGFSGKGFFSTVALRCTAESFHLSLVLMGLIGADIAHVVREACMSVLKENRGGVGPVSQRHLLKAVSDTVRSKAAHYYFGHVNDFPSSLAIQVPSIPPGSDEFYRQFEKRARGGGGRSAAGT